jgi:hypothetical protein
MDIHRAHYRGNPHLGCKWEQPYFQPSLELSWQNRLTNLHDISIQAPYFFVDPDLTTEEAMEMVRTIVPEERSRSAKGIAGLGLTVPFLSCSA